MNNRVLKALSLSLISALASCSLTVKSIDDLEADRSGHRLTEAQLAYINSENYGDTTPYNGNMSVSAPNPVTIKWKSTGISKYKVSLYNDSDLTDLVVSYSTKKTSFDFYNDELNRTYYVKVSDESGENYMGGNMIKYKYTQTMPRNLFIDGVENVRDIAGWVANNDSVSMKQGMLYRSGRFNEDKAEEVNVTVTSDGIYELKNHLKIKTEIDLRRSSTNEIGSITSSPLGEDVNYYNFPMYYGGNNILTFVGKASGDTYQYDNPAAIKQVFELLANEDNYPIDFHCSIGKDRTGCIAYLIEGLMGFDQETMYRDYMFTNFSNAGMCKLTDITDRYGKTIDEYSEGTLQQKTFKYLNEVIGVSSDKLNHIIEILR